MRTTVNTSFIRIELLGKVFFFGGSPRSDWIMPPGSHARRSALSALRLFRGNLATIWRKQVADSSQPTRSANTVFRISRNYAEVARARGFEGTTQLLNGLLSYFGGVGDDWTSAAVFFGILDSSETCSSGPPVVAKLWVSP